MKFLLDTNICITLLKGGDKNLIDKLKKSLPEDFALCSIVKAELNYGVQKSKYRYVNEKKLEIFVSQFLSLAFDDECARIYGSIRSTLERLGEPIGPNDLLIASIAIQNNLTLITRNISEFEKVSNLKIEKW